MVLQCIRFLAQHYQLHEKDREYRQRETDKRSRAPAAVMFDSELQTTDSVDVESAANKSCDDQESNSSRMTVEAGSVDDIQGPCSSSLCGISENTVNGIVSMCGSDSVVPVSSVASVICSADDTSITQCSSENGDIIADKVTLRNNGTDDMIEDSNNASTQFDTGIVDITAGTSDAVASCHTTSDIGTNLSDLVTQHNKNIGDTQCNKWPVDMEETVAHCSNDAENGLSLIMSNYANI